MLRRRLSAGALRARAQAQPQLPAHAHAIHTGPKSAPASPSRAQRLTTPSSSAAKATINAHPAQQQSASLASAVLLGTQRSWKNETVVTLRAELKRRGLSQQGKKALLISRLESADASAFLPPVPPLSPAAKAAKGQRTLSTTPPTAFRGDATSKSSDPADTEAVSSTGPAVETPLAEATFKAHDVTPEVLTTAPGLPIKHKSSDLLNIKFPTPKPDVERSTPIPLIGSYSGRGSSSSSSRGGSVPSSSGPRVMTVASASTHIGGGPVHGSSRVSDSYAAEFHDFSHLLSQSVEEVITHPMISLRSVGVPIPVINLPPAQKGQDKYVANTDPLSSDEKRGALWLAGALGTAFLLAGWSRGGREDVFADDDEKNATRAAKVAEKADAKAESARESLNKLQIKNAEKESKLQSKNEAKENALKTKDLKAEANAQRKVGRAEAHAAAAHVNAQTDDVRALIEAIKKALDAEQKGK